MQYSVKTKHILGEMLLSREVHKFGQLYGKQGNGGKINWSNDQHMCSLGHFKRQMLWAYRGLNGKSVSEAKRKIRI